MSTNLVAYINLSTFGLGKSCVTSQLSRCSVHTLTSGQRFFILHLVEVLSWIWSDCFSGDFLFLICLLLSSPFFRVHQNGAYPKNRPYQFLDSWMYSYDSLLCILGSVWLLWNSCDKIISKILVGLDSHWLSMMFFNDFWQSWHSPFFM